MTTNTDELIKSLPSQWRCIPLKQYFEFGKGLPITKADLVDEGEKVISYGQVHAKYNTGVHVDDQLIRYVSPDYLETNRSSLCSKGDFIFADTSEDREGCGNAVYVDTDTPIFAGYHTIILRSKKNNKYLAYLFLSDGWRSQIRSRVQGIKVFSITQKILSQCQIWFPPTFEQQAIADYLDDRCSKIDEIIAEATASIEEYKELKQAVIFEAVTKGLDKNAPMKDSGVEWIGKIPANWALVRIPRILDYSDIYPLGDGDHGMIKTEDYLNEGIPYIRVQNLGWGTDLLLDNVVYISEDNNNKIKNSQLKPNDVLFCKTGGTIGKTGIVPIDLPISNTTSHVGKITVNPVYSPRYVFYVLSSYVGYRQFWEIACQKTTRPELSIAETRQIRLTWPSCRKEQDDIVQYLDAIVPEYEALISEKQSLIDDLQAYKKSLIYEVVTGKRRVV